MSKQHYFCPLCVSSNVFHTYYTLFMHIRNEHRYESPFNIRCELSSSCGSKYSSFDSYRRHIYRCHRSLIDSFDLTDKNSSNIDDSSNDLETLLSSRIFNNEPSIPDDYEVNIDQDEEIDDANHEFLNYDIINLSMGSGKLNLSKLAQFYTRFLLELREHHLLPQKLVQLISTNVCTLLSMIVQSIEFDSSATDVSISDLQSTFTSVTRIIDSISKNEYNFLKQCEKYFNYQPPCEIILKTGEQPAYYIPIKQSLFYVLRNGDLLKAINDNVKFLSARSAENNPVRQYCLKNPLKRVRKSLIHSFNDLPACKRRFNDLSMR